MVIVKYVRSQLNRSALTADLKRVAERMPAFWGNIEVVVALVCEEGTAVDRKAVEEYVSGLARKLRLEVQTRVFDLGALRRKYLVGA
jgi:hypothetical protein